MNYPNLETNKRIARFMGYEYIVKVGWCKGPRFTKFFKLLARHHFQLKYDYDYNWQMKVLEKIRSMGHSVFLFSYTTGTNECTIILEEELLTGKGETLNNAIYQAILKFLDKEQKTQ